MRPALLLAACLATTLAAREARACDGFFCNSPTPVDRTAEQIILATEGDKGATYVQLRFTGSAPDFGWIVPATPVPGKVETSDIAVFDELQQPTAPEFLAPPVKLRFEFDQFGHTNCRAVPGEAIDAAGGRGFVAEDAGRSSVLRPQAPSDAARQLLPGAPYVTRLSSGFSPGEMSADLVFPPSEEGKLPDVSHVHQLGDEALAGGGAPLVLAARRRRRS